MKRVIIGGIVAGVVVFVWGAVSHMALPIGTMGIRVISNEETVVEPVKKAIKEPGFYIFPGKDMHRELTESEQKEWMDKYQKGPTGILIVHPEGGEAMSPRQLGTEVATNILCSLLAAFLLSHVRATYPRRVLFVTLLGIFGFITVSVPYWNWYGFPLDFTAAEAIDQVVGWFLAGLVLAAIVRPTPEKPALV
jgi:hypothetical protein